MFDSSLPPVVCRRAHVLLTLFVFFAHSGVQQILCCVFVLFFLVLCTLCCQFLWIVHFHFLFAPSVFFNVYLDFECTWRRLFQKRFVCTKFDIYVFIKIWNHIIIPWKKLTWLYLLLISHYIKYINLSLKCTLVFIDTNLSDIWYYRCTYNCVESSVIIIPWTRSINWIIPLSSRF
jgi:hypothetical protein